MSLILKPAPDFTVAALMPDGGFKDISLSDYKGKKYVLLFFYPLDFTFVCPTEIIAFSKAAADFDKLNVQILGCSVDSQYTHLAWVQTDRKEGGIGEIEYPLLADVRRELITAYGVGCDAGHAVRGTFLINKEGIVMHETINAPPIGRNVEEELRCVKALQFFEKNGEVCPANWHEGDGGIKPDPVKSQEFFKKSN
ncbi:MAG: peroxiredoxin [Planctomycetaceae bacterium]|jgi:peroxiredoxin (alkyl hydroperoxide reductase subunit C)|nr:peroxiredoxin [Planctomycetaceae bacterium]